MPQKKNPDAAELVRGHAGRIIGSLTSLMITMKGLPLAYSKDMQDDKPPVFEAAGLLTLCLAAMTGMVESTTFRTDRMRQAAELGYATATDLADWLVRQANIPFREAHHITGAAVKLAESKGLRWISLALMNCRRSTRASPMPSIPHFRSKHRWQAAPAMAARPFSGRTACGAGAQRAWYGVTPLCVLHFSRWLRFWRWRAAARRANLNRRRGINCPSLPSVARTGPAPMSCSASPRRPVPAAMWSCTRALNRARTMLSTCRHKIELGGKRPLQDLRKHGSFSLR
jgi:hypothetical protein